MISDKELKEFVFSLATSIKESNKNSEKEFKEIREIQKETQKEMREAQKEMRETQKEIREIREIQKETQKEMRETQKEMRETDRKLKTIGIQLGETDRKLKSIGIQLGNVVNNLGDIAEEYFINSLQNKMELLGMKFDSLSANLHKIKGRLENEYDIVLLNGKNVAIIEVKYKLHINDVKKLEKKINAFKELFPEYAHLNLYAGVASFKVYEDAKEFAKKKGYFILQRNGNIIETYAPTLKKVS